MSSLRKRSEHIERIRYPNPLPLPPYPPKLLAIPTPASRFANPQKFGPRLAQAHPLPVVVDAEAGMPLNLTDFPQAWYTDQELEADDDVFPRLDTTEVDVDPEDAFLLSDMLDKLPGPSNGAVRGGEASSSGIVDSSHITWLRRTEYLAAEQQKRKKNDMALRAGEAIDASKEAQLARIKNTFDVANQPLENVRHPTKPHLRAVDAHSLLPDPDTWSTRFDVFRFGDLPGRTQDNKALHDPRLHTAIVRPHLDAIGSSLYSLFLADAPLAEADETNDKQGTDDDDDDMFGEDGDGGDESKPKKKKARLDSRTAEEVLAEENDHAARLAESRRKGMRVDAEVQDIENDPFSVEQSEEDPAHLKHIRDYEAHDEITRKDQELIFTFIEQSPGSLQNESGKELTGTLPPVSEFERRYRATGKESEANGQTSKGEITKVAYYHPVSMRASLRVRRRRAGDEQPPQHWDAISLQKRSLSMYEKVNNLHLRSAVDAMDSSRMPERIELPAEELIEEEQEEEAVAAGGREDEGVEKRANGVTADARSDSSSAERDGEEDEDVRRKSNAIASVDDEEEDEDDEAQGTRRKGADDGASASGSDDDADDAEQSDEEMDEDELAALQADAGEDAPADAEEEAGGRRRSRRAAAAAVADDENGETSRAPRRELLSMDVDEEE